MKTSFTKENMQMANKHGLSINNWEVPEPLEWPS